jgi:hypothetical protein
MKNSILKKALGALLFLWIFSSGSAAWADEHLAEEKAGEWSPPSAGPITTWTAPLCGQGHILVQPFFIYNHFRGEFDSGGHYSALPSGDKEYQYQEQFFTQVGLTDRFEMDAQAVYQQNYKKQGDVSANSSGWGDTYAFPRYCLIDETNNCPHVTAICQLKFPTGKYEKLDPDKLGTDSMGASSGGGSFDHGYGVILTKRLKPFILHADVIYSFPQSVKVDDIKTDYADYLNCDFGVEYFLPKGFNLMFEVNGFFQADKKEEGERIPGSAVNYWMISPGVGWSNDTIQFLIAYQRTVSGTNIDANDSVIATLVYTF